jgi:hypothetical protein
MALMLLPADGHAQNPATSFDELRRVVRDGDEVAVVDTNGRRTRGKLLTVTTSSVELATSRFWRWQKPRQQVFMAPAVTTVTHMDSPWEGVLIGFAAGFVPVTVAACSRDDQSGGDCFVSIMLGGPAIGFLGMAIGGLIDWKHSTTVYRRSTPTFGRASFTVSPLVGARMTGGSVSLRF